VIVSTFTGFSIFKRLKMVATIILSVLIGIWLIINIRRMILNVKEGKSIDGCDGNCAHCKGCHANASSKKKKKV
jgi:hypothetical protein